MKIKTVFAAAVIASTSTMSFAGDVSDAGTNDVFIPVLTETAASSSSGSKYVVPAILGLLVLGAAASGGGS